MSNDKLAEQLAKLKETLAKWEKELIVYGKWAIENDGILSDIENQVIQYIKTEILGIKDHIVKIEKAKGTDNGNPGKTFTADTKKAWNFNTFQSESEQVVVDKTKLTAGQIAYFETYEKVAQTYINRMSQIYEGKNNYANSEKKEPIHKLPIPLTGKMLADAALKTFVKYGNDISKVVPVELMLAQCQGESHFGTVIPRKGSAKSPFNVGVYDTKDAAFLDQVENMEEGVEMYYDLMAEDYLSARSADELDDNFVNENGLRYASSKDYEKMMKIIEDSVKSVIGKNGLKLPNADDLANNNPAPIDNNDSNTHTNQDQNITRSITGSVGVYGVNNMEDVKIIQKLLNEKINAGLTVDGYCGNFTETAIKEFQQKTFGWEDGLVEVGGKTWDALSGKVVVSNPSNSSTQNQNSNINNSSSSGNIFNNSTKEETNNPELGIGGENTDLYDSQRDNVRVGLHNSSGSTWDPIDPSKVHPDAQCNVTSLAMQLVGLANGDRAKVINMAKAIIVQKRAQLQSNWGLEEMLASLVDSMGYSIYGPAGLKVVAELFTDLVKKIETYGALSTKEQFEQYVVPALKAGAEVIFGANHTSAGHICSLVGVREDGIIVNDPFGAWMSKGVFLGNKGSNNVYVGGYANIKAQITIYKPIIERRLKINGSVQAALNIMSTGAQLPANMGEKNFYSWDDVTKVGMRWVQIVHKK